MRNLILIVMVIVLVGAGYFAFQRQHSSTPVVVPEQTGSSKITSAQAVKNVKNLPEVQDYLKRVPNGKIEVDNEGQGEYSVHVYEVKDGHTATFNWYRVSIESGKVEPQFNQ